MTFERLKRPPLGAAHAAGRIYEVPPPGRKTYVRILYDLVPLLLCMFVGTLDIHSSIFIIKVVLLDVKTG